MRKCALTAAYRKDENSKHDWIESRIPFLEAGNVSSKVAWRKFIIGNYTLSNIYILSLAISRDHNS